MSKHLRLADEAEEKARAVDQSGKWRVDPDDPHTVHIWRVIVGSYQEAAPITICKGVPRNIAEFVGYTSPEKVSDLASAIRELHGHLDQALRQWTMYANAERQHDEGWIEEAKDAEAQLYQAAIAALASTPEAREEEQ